MLGFLGCEMCLFQNLYAEGFVDSFAAIIFHLFGLELITILDPWNQSFFSFKNITMTLEQCTTSLDKVNKKRKYRTTISCGTILYGEDCDW